MLSALCDVRSPGWIPVSTASANWWTKTVVLSLISIFNCPGRPLRCKSSDTRAFTPLITESTSTGHRQRADQPQRSPSTVSPMTLVTLTTTTNLPPTRPVQTDDKLTIRADDERPPRRATAADWQGRWLTERWSGGCRLGGGGGRATIATPPDLTTRPTSLGHIGLDSGQYPGRLGRRSVG